MEMGVVISVSKSRIFWVGGAHGVAVGGCSLAPSFSQLHNFRFFFLATRIPDLSLTNTNFKKKMHQGSLSDQSAFDYPTVPQNCTKITKED
jgi:hypothetical protein